MDSRPARSLRRPGLRRHRSVRAAPSPSLAFPSPRSLCAQLSKNSSERLGCLPIAQNGKSTEGKEGERFSTGFSPVGEKKKKAGSGLGSDLVPGRSYTWYLVCEATLSSPKAWATYPQSRRLSRTPLREDSTRGRDGGDNRSESGRDAGRDEAEARRREAGNTTGTTVAAEARGEGCKEGVREVQVRLAGWRVGSSLSLFPPNFLSLTRSRSRID